MTDELTYPNPGATSPKTVPPDDPSLLGELRLFLRTNVLWWLTLLGVFGILFLGYCIVKQGERIAPFAGGLF